MFHKKALGLLHDLIYLDDLLGCDQIAYLTHAVVMT